MMKIKKKKNRGKKDGRQSYASEISGENIKLDQGSLFKMFFRVS